MRGREPCAGGIARAFALSDRTDTAITVLATKMLFGSRQCTFFSVSESADAAVHRDAREPVGIEPRDLLLGLEPFDHPHRGVVHGLVQVGILGMR